MSATAVTVSQVAAAYGVPEGRIAELVEKNAGTWYGPAHAACVETLIEIAAIFVVGIAAVALLAHMARDMEDGLGYLAAAALLVAEVVIVWPPLSAMLQSPAMAADPDQAYLQYLVEEERRGEPVQLVYAEDASDADEALQ